jgi:hypothetical protein
VISPRWSPGRRKTGGGRQRGFFRLPNGACDMLVIKSLSLYSSKPEKGCQTSILFTFIPNLSCPISFPFSWFHTFPRPKLLLSQTLDLIIIIATPSLFLLSSSQTTKTVTEIVTGKCTPKWANRWEDWSSHWSCLQPISTAMDAGWNPPLISSDRGSKRSA